MRTLLAVALMTGLAAPALAQTPVEMQSDWLELVKGHRDGKTGAQIMGVSQDPSTGYHTALVKVPKASMEDDSDMEEVTVTGQAPEEMELPEVLPEMETEWVDDYDNDHYGLLVKLKSDQKIPFRLFFSAEGQGGTADGATQP